MRIIIYVLLSIFLGMLTGHGQQTTSTTTASSSSVSISVDGGNVDYQQKGRTYFSISDSDDNYKVRSEFHKDKTAKIRSYLLEELGNEYLTTSGNKYNWKRAYAGDMGYEVKLNSGTLKIYLDKELLSNGMIKKFKTITQNIKDYTSGKSSEERTAEKLKREEEKMGREAERLERQAEQKLREAERLKREAERLKREAKRKTDN